MYVYRKNPTFFILRHLFYELFCFLHNSLIIILALSIFGNFNLYYGLLTLLNFVLLTFTLYQLSSFISFIGGRYSDFRELIGSLMTIIFFTSPILWVKDFDNLLVNLNFAYHLIEIIREPLISNDLNLFHLAWVVIFNIFLFFLNVIAYKKIRNRIIIWPL